MKHRTTAIIFFILALILFSFTAGMIFERYQENLEGGPLTKFLQEHKILDGSSLRGMMNEAKYSPGRAIVYAIDYPTYAYLFDGSFITYVDN